MIRVWLALQVSRFHWLEKYKRRRQSRVEKRRHQFVIAARLDEGRGTRNTLFDFSILKLFFRFKNIWLFSNTKCNNHIIGCCWTELSMPAQCTVHCTPCKLSLNYLLKTMYSQINVATLGTYIHQFLTDFILNISRLPITHKNLKCRWWCEIQH